MVKHLLLLGLLAYAAPAAAQVLPRAGWFAVPDSTQNRDGFNHPSSNVLDGNAQSFWHSQWLNAGPTGASPLPHTLDIVMGGQVNSVSGLRYLPRQDAASNNGNCGRFEIRLSADGTTYPAGPVAAGTWADTKAAKTVTFAAKPAMAVRLTCLTEAGNRGPFTAAAEINILGRQQKAANKAAIGSWGPLIRFPLVPVAAALLANNKILMWSAYGEDRFGVGVKAQTATATYDIGSGAISRMTITNTNHDMFCSGTSMLGNGDVVVTGGDNDEKTSIFRVGSNSWTPGPNMLTRRGYQAQATLSDGEVFVHGGSWSGGRFDKKAEVLDPTAATVKWRKLTSLGTASILTADKAGIYRSDNHAWLFAWSGQSVFHAGPHNQMNWFGIGGTGTQNPAGTRPGGNQMNGNAVMYDNGKILSCGGAPSYDTTPAIKGAQVISIGAPTKPVTARSTAAMKYARAFAGSVALPDGNVLTIGGQTVPLPFRDEGAILVPELWNRQTEQWTSLAPMGAPRTYHSVVLLLPDGRVFSGGGGLCGQNNDGKGCDTNHFDGQMFSPPYLFKGPRPTISVPGDGVVNNGQRVTITSNVRLQSVCIIRYGTTTHTVNTDQRRLELCGPVAGACTAGNTNTVTIPIDPGRAIPGPYMLFGVSQAGVPSVSRKLTVGQLPPRAAQTFAAVVADGGVQATDAGGTAAPLNETFPELPAKPAIEYPANLQQD